MKRILYNSNLVVDFVYGSLGALPQPGAIGFGTTDGKRILGGVAFDSYRKDGSIALHVASSTPRWLTRGLLGAVFGYAFRSAGVRKVVSPVSSSNEHTQKFAESAGLTLEARISEAASDGDDLLIYSMHRDTCRFLSDRYELKPEDIFLGELK